MVAISWGPRVRNSRGNWGRLGVQWVQSPASVAASTTSVTVTVEVWFQSGHSVHDSSNRLVVGGSYSFSGSRPISHSSGSMTRLWTGTRQVAPSFTGTTPVSISANLTGIEAFGAGTRITLSSTHAVGRRPIQTPAAPTGLAAKRVSDLVQELSWSPTSPSAAGRPYQGQVISRWVDSDQVWRDIATVGASSRSYTVSGLVENRYYRFSVRARNSAGDSPRAFTEGWVFTRPAAPSGVSARKVGSDIVVSWSGEHHAKDDYVSLLVEHATDGVWGADPVASLPGGATSWTHESPDPSVTHTYRVRARVEVADLTSGPSVASNAVQLLAAPAAPSRLTPSSGAFDADRDIVLSWEHNPVDTTGQTGREVQYRHVGASSWTSAGRVTSGQESLTIPAGTLTNGLAYEWRVRTWGDHDQASPWSKTVVFQTSAAPTATILAPGEVVESSQVRAQWSFYDPEGTSQVQARLRLETYDGLPVWQDTVAGGVDSFQLPVTVQDEAAYILHVAVRDGHGVWSQDATQVFTVAYALPAPSSIEATWDVERGAVALYVAPGEDQDAPATVANLVERRLPGSTWEPVGDRLPVETTITDPIPPLGQVVEYRVLAISALPSTAVSEPVEVFTDARGWVYVNWGPAWGELVKVRDNAQVSYEEAHVKERLRFAGRTYPVEFASTGRDVKITLSAKIGGGSSTLAQWQQVAHAPAPLCYRDIERLEYVSSDPVSASFRRINQEISVSFEAVDHDR